MCCACHRYNFTMLWYKQDREHQTTANIYFNYNCAYFNIITDGKCKPLDKTQ